MFRFTLAFVLLATAAGTSSPAFAQTDPQAAFARPQQMVDIGGRRLNLYCSGTGPVTVVFEAYSGGAGWTWASIQPAIATRTRACVYDRAGLGFSDPSPRPGTAGNAVEDLHKLLGAAGIAPPFVLVGTSYGGGIVQLYTYRYPSEVKGLVLPEPQHEDETPRLDKASGGRLKGLYAMLEQRDQACLAQSEKGFVPGSALWQACIGPLPEGNSLTLAAARLAVQRTPASWRASISENTHMELGDAELRAARKPFGDLPIIVLSRSMSPYAVPGKPQSAANKAMEAENVAIHTELAALSTRGSHRIVPGAHHIIHEEQPQAVIDAIHAMLTMVETR